MRDDDPELPFAPRLDAQSAMHAYEVGQAHSLDLGLPDLIGHGEAHKLYGIVTMNLQVCADGVGGDSTHRHEARKIGVLLEPHVAVRPIRVIWASGLGRRGAVD